MTPREPERTATAAELADERAKLDRAATGAWREVAAQAAACVPPGDPARQRCNARTDADLFTCNIDQGHDGPHVAYGPGGAEVCHTWPQADAALTRLPGLRAYASPCCGVVASVPSHQSFCDARHAARIWRSAPAVATREASAELHAFLDATPLGDPDDPDADWLTEYMTLAGALHAATTEHLAELDREAGAQ